MTSPSLLFQGRTEVGVSGGRGGAGRRGRRLADGQARLPGLRQPRDPQVQHGVLRQGRRHVGARSHALHHARRKVRLSNVSIFAKLVCKVAFTEITWTRTTTDGDSIAI